MTLRTTVDSMEYHLSEAYGALEEMGAEIPEQKNFANLATAIGTIDGHQTLNFGTIYYSDKSYTLTSQAELDILCGNSSDDFLLGGESIPRFSVTAFEFGKDAVTVGTRFLQSCPNLTSVIFNDTLTSIDDYFLIDCSAFNGEFTLPSTPLRIGAGFLLRCTSFAKSLTLPSTIASLSTRFLEGCDNFTGPLIVNTNLYPGANGSLATPHSTAPMYVTGVTLTGTGASAWKTALPDKTTSLYRKLILG